MKKKVIAVLFAILFSIMGVATASEMAYAQDAGEDVSLSAIMTDDALIGYSQNQTRGVYLVQGVSVINDAGGGKIGCGGITEAASKCNVKILCILERKVGSSWLRVTSWSDEEASAYSVSISKYYSVGSGYYYRVRSTHYAASDASNSYTAAMWM